MNCTKRDINYINKADKLTLKDVLRDDSDLVKIFSTGSCNTKTRCGRYKVLIEYKSHYKVIEGDLTDTTVNRCIITGLIEAVKLLKKPYKVYVVTSTLIGISKATRNGKGPNADVVKILLETLNQKQCDPSFIAVKGEGEKLNRHISKVRSLNPGYMSQPIKKQMTVYAYSSI